MQSNNRIFAYNNSKVLGGQESYLLLMKSNLNTYKLDFNIVGGPQSISSGRCLSEIKSKDILVLNGNKSLYDLVRTKYINQPSIYIQHSDINDSQGPFYKIFIRKFLLYIFLKKVDAVIRVCNKCFPDKYAKGKVYTVYNGVDLKVKTPRKLGDSVNLLMVGALNDNKNQKLAIDALPYMQDVMLTLVGSGEHVDKLISRAIDLGVSDRVHFTGFQDDPTPYYKDTDLLLMLSKNEGFPFVVLEAMAYGIPVVSVPVGGVPEVVQNLENGLLLSDYQPQSLATAIIEIKKNKALYTKLSRNSIETIESKFSLEQMTQGFLAVLNQVIEKRGIK